MRQSLSFIASFFIPFFLLSLSFLISPAKLYAVTCDELVGQSCLSGESACHPGGDCANLQCEGFRGRCSLREGATTASGATPVPTPTSIPLASPCNSWNEIDETGKVLKPNAIPITPGQPYPTLPEGRKFKCATVDTAIGSLQTDPVQLVKQVFGILLSLAGGIALLLIIYSGYQILTSEGNPEKLQAARETLTSAIIGLVFLIFSLVILQIIGVDILRIPGFAK